MGNLGVSDRYIDAFYGRTPKSVLARHYTYYNPERLRSIYEQANLTVLMRGDRMKKETKLIDLRTHYFLDWFESIWFGLRARIISIDVM